MIDRLKGLLAGPRGRGARRHGHDELHLIGMPWQVAYADGSLHDDEA